MTSVEVPMCMECANLLGAKKEKLSCLAFPAGIPETIITGDHDHTEPFNGDRGILFKPLPKPGAPAPEAEPATDEDTPDAEV